MATVRQATIEDLGEVWRLLMMGHRENGVFRLAPQKVRALLSRCLAPEMYVAPNDTGPRGIIGVIGQQGKLEGIAFLIVGQFWYSDEYHLEELLVFVDPECRKSDNADSLITWMKSVADKTGLKLLTGIISRDRTQAKIRLYDRKLPRIGAFYLYPMRGTDLKKRNHDMERESWLAAK